ncbi:MAG: DUF5808 domain-containing protein [Acidobacteriaceae bacterium]
MTLMTLFRYLPVFIPLLVGGVLLVYPVSNHSGVFLGTSVPLDFPGGPQARRILRDYRVRGAMIFLLCLAWGIVELQGHQPNRAAAIGMASIFFYLMNWTVTVRQTRPYRIVTPLVRTVDLGDTSEYRKFLWAFVLAFLPLAFAALYLALHWQHIPAVFPIHWGFNGQPNGWMHRTFMGVFGGILFASGFELFFLCSSLLVRRTPNGQKTGLTIMALAAWMVSLGLAVGSLLPLTLLRPRSLFLSSISVAMGAAAIVLTIAMMVVSVRFATHVENGSEAYDGTPDACWYGGLFYFNTKDHAVLVQKRFGYGWTFNLARPQTWLIMLLLLVPMLLFMTRRMWK